MTGDHARRHRDLEEVDELASVAKAAIVSCVAFLVGIPALLAVWGRFEPDVVALGPLAIVAMVVALIALGGGLAAAACGSAADAMPRAARAYRRTGLVVGYLSLLLVVSETAVIALAVILGYATG